MSRARHKKAEGGRTNMKVSGNPDVFKEASDRKKGGKCRATGGGVGTGVGAAAPATKSVGRMTGGAVKARMDRPGRKVGGRVGANTSPLSTAHGTCSAPSQPASSGGGN
jgi:hypothetical protein